MTYEAATHFLVNSIMILAGMYLWFFAYRAIRIDDFRSSLFSMRDDLFSYAVSNDLIHHPAYGMQRELINRTIRYAESMSIWHLLFYAFASSLVQKTRSEKSIRVQLVESIQGIEDAQVRKRLMQFHAQFQIDLVRFLFMRSLPLWLALNGLAVSFYLAKFFNGQRFDFNERLRPYSEKFDLEDQAYLMGGAA